MQLPQGPPFSWARACRHRICEAIFYYPKTWGHMNLATRSLNQEIWPLGCHPAKIIDNIKGLCDKSVPAVFLAKTILKARHARDKIVEAVACAMALALATKLQKPRPERRCRLARPTQPNGRRLVASLCRRPQADRPRVASFLRRSPRRVDQATRPSRATAPEQSFGLQPSQLRLQAALATTRAERSLKVVTAVGPLLVSPPASGMQTHLAGEQ